MHVLFETKYILHFGAEKDITFLKISLLEQSSSLCICARFSCNNWQVSLGSLLSNLCTLLLLKIKVEKEANFWNPFPITIIELKYVLKKWKLGIFFRGSIDICRERSSYHLRRYLPTFRHCALALRAVFFSPCPPNLKCLRGTHSFFFWYTSMELTSFPLSLSISL